MKRQRTASLFFSILLTMPMMASGDEKTAAEPQALSLITADPDEGFALAIKLARRGVSTTQTDRQVLMEGRKKYSVAPDSLIAASQVVAIHFQTIAEANDYWKD